MSHNKLVSVTDLKIIEFGITSLCNAGCPLCNRHVPGTNTVIPGLKLTSMSYEKFEKITNDLGKHASHITAGFWGVVGDNAAHPEIEKILNLSASCYKNTQLETNGGIRSPDFWSRLGKLSSLSITFSIDGLKDTNAIYRINTDFDRIIANASAYIKAGGRAEWKYIVFKHNEHQVEQAEQLAKDLGFEKFRVHHSKRFHKQSHPVSRKSYNANINKIPDHVKNDGIELLPSTLVETEYEKHLTLNQAEDISGQTIDCKTIRRGQIYIDENNKLWPCCYFNTPSYYSQKFFAYWNDIEKKYGKDFNSLDNQSIVDLLEHDYFSNYLPSSWTDSNLKYCYQCPSKCGNSQYNQNIEEHKKI